MTLITVLTIWRH